METTVKQRTELISQADAARLKGVTRQRIEQLIKAERLTLHEVKIFGRQKKRLDKNQVLDLEEGTRGRPRLSTSERNSRGEHLHGYTLGQPVFYSQYIKGLQVTVEAEVVKVGAKRIRIEYLDAEDKPTQGWVRPDMLTRGIKLNDQVSVEPNEASDNEPESEDASDNETAAVTEPVGLTELRESFSATE